MHLIWLIGFHNHHHYWHHHHQGQNHQLSLMSHLRWPFKWSYDFLCCQNSRHHHLDLDLLHLHYSHHHQTTSTTNNIHGHVQETFHLKCVIIHKPEKFNWDQWFVFPIQCYQLLSSLHYSTAYSQIIKWRSTLNVLMWANQECIIQNAIYKHSSNNISQSTC